MMQSLCPGGHRLQALLEEGGARDEADELVRHLESCLDCQETLQELAAPSDDWACTARGLRDEARTEPALHRLVGRLKEEDPLSGEDGGFSFLRPTDKPGLLGLLDRYEVREEIGRGGMGVVLKALDPDLNRIVAIKVLSPWLAGNATARRRFIREAKAAAAVCHDHIVTVHGVDAAEGLPYLVMQYVAGESLQERLDRAGPLDVEEGVRIGLQAASGLAAAHAQGLIHRDVKPANLLLENGVARVKITDFGLARMTDDVGLTQNGVIAGTPEYMAPEQARGDVVDHRADLFSLGSVLYACCTGSPPFRGSTALAVLRLVNEETPAPIRSLNPNVPAWLEAFIDRLMVKDPAQRFQSAVEAATLLEGYLAHLRQSATVAAPELPPPQIGDQPRPPSSRSRHTSAQWFRHPFGLVTLVLAAVLGAAVAAWLAGVEPPIVASEQYKQSFQGGPEEPPGWQRFGPGAEEEVQFEPSGLRITLPLDSPKGTGTGVRSTFGVQGDFEITVHFDILQESAPATPGKKARFTMAVLLDRPGFNMAAMSWTAHLEEAMRAHPKSRDQFQAWVTLWNEATDNNKDRLRGFPTEARTGQLRIARSGSTLSFYASEGRDGDFVLLQKYPFGDENLKDIRLVGATDDPRRGSLDVRISDLRIRASSFPGLTETVTKGRGKLKAAAIIGVGVVLLLAIPLGGWFVRRRRCRGKEMSSHAAAAVSEIQTETAAPSESFSCAGCGKKLRVRAELAGKKVKCPHCGKVTVVPSIKMAKTGE